MNIFRYYLCATSGVLLYHTTVVAATPTEARGQGRLEWTLEVLRRQGNPDEGQGLEWVVPEDTMDMIPELEVPADLDVDPEPCVGCGAPVRPSEVRACPACVS